MALVEVQISVLRVFRQRVRSLTMTGRVLLVLVLTVCLAAPSAATAATTCDYASQVLQVDLGASGDYAGLEVAAGGEIVLKNGGGAQVACTGGSPTVTNTNAVSVFNHPGSHDNAVVIEGADSFAPGPTPEPGDDEIELFVLLNDGPGSSLRVRTGSLGGNLRFGTSGINSNASPAEDTPDADIFPTSVPELFGYGAVGPAPDTLGAQGGAGTGNALTAGVGSPRRGRGRRGQPDRRRGRMTPSAGETGTTSSSGWAETTPSCPATATTP